MLQQWIFEHLNTDRILAGRQREIFGVRYACFIDYAKAFDCEDHKKTWKSIQEMGIPDHLTCLPRNLYAVQEATVRIGHGTMDWFQIGKGVHQGCILSVQFSSVIQLCPTLCDAMDCRTPGFPVHHQLPDLLKIMSIESVMPSNHPILCYPLLLLPSVFPSIRIFSNESVLHIWWPKYIVTLLI